MVEMMEAWFHADPGALAEFYGSDFRKAALRGDSKAVEKIPKKDIENGLKAAPKKTPKGNYFDHKASHGSELLKKIRPNLVCQAAPNCDRLFLAILTHLN